MKCPVCFRLVFRSNDYIYYIDIFRPLWRKWMGAPVFLEFFPHRWRGFERHRHGNHLNSLTGNNQKTQLINTIALCRLEQKRLQRKADSYLLRDKVQLICFLVMTAIYRRQRCYEIQQIKILKSLCVHSNKASVVHSKKLFLEKRLLCTVLTLLK